MSSVVSRGGPGPRGEQAEGKPGAKPDAAGVDPTIEQVRELLFGQAQRTNEQRDKELNQTIDALRREMMERFAAMEARMDELAHETTRRHSTTVEAIGSAIADLGAHVRKLAEPPARK